MDCTCSYVGMRLIGYCQGYFSRDSYGEKIIEAVGRDWIVVRDYLYGPIMASFSDKEKMISCIEYWTSDEYVKEWTDRI